MGAPARNSGSNNYIGRYELKTKAGEGASGIVYRAYDPLLDREVAIKKAKAEALSKDDLKMVIEEFYHEARIAGKFAHPNIITIYDVIDNGMIDYMVVEYVPGRSVQDYMDATGPLDVEETLDIIYKCCLGLEYIHYHGVIHRDIKPGNIMYHPAQGMVKIMDFGVSHKIEEPPSRDTGTIAYMAPEHFDRERRISELTDIFALGSTMYRILTGKYPFDNRHTAFQIMHDDPEPMSSLRDGIPDVVEHIVKRAMAKADSDRYQSATAFAFDVEKALRELYPNAKTLDTSGRFISLPS